MQIRKKRQNISTFHTSRHSFVSLVTLEEGVPIETISKMLGHNNIQTTQIYARVTAQKGLLPLMQVTNLKLESNDERRTIGSHLRHS